MSLALPCSAVIISQDFLSLGFDMVEKKKLPGLLKCQLLKSSVVKLGERPHEDTC